MLFMQSKCQQSDLNIGPIRKKREILFCRLSFSFIAYQFNWILYGRNGRYITVNKSRTQHRCECQRGRQGERERKMKSDMLINSHVRNVFLLLFVLLFVDLFRVVFFSQCLYIHRHSDISEIGFTTINHTRTNTETHTHSSVYTIFICTQNLHHFT